MGMVAGTMSTVQAQSVFVKDDSCDDLPVAVTCGTVDVPENQTTDSGPLITLDVYILRATNDEKVDDPIVFLDGGPGGRASSNFAALSEMEKLREKRDIIIVNQRGTSTDKWLCPRYELDEAFIVAGNIDFDTANKRIAGAIKDCFNSLREFGREPSHYTNHANAEDLKDVRRALDIDQWNLWGTSYGTALAQQIMKVDPAGVRSAALDSVVPLDTGWVRGGVDHRRGAFQALNEDCQADPRCVDRFGDLNDLRIAALSAVKKSPLFFEEGIGRFRFQDESIYEAHAVDDDRDLYLNDHDLARIINGFLYSDYNYPVIPLLLDRVVAGDMVFMDRLIDNLVGGVTDTDYGVHFAIGCRFPLPTDAEIEAEHDRNREWLQGIPKMRYFQTICAALDLPPVPPEDHLLPNSTAPVLIIAGERDPVTPAWFGEHLAAVLPNSQVARFGEKSHGPGYSRCGITLLTDFFDRPFKTKVRNCEKSAATVEFMIDLVGVEETTAFAKKPAEGFWPFAKSYTSIILAAIICLIGSFFLVWDSVSRRGSDTVVQRAFSTQLVLAISSLLAVGVCVWLYLSSVQTIEKFPLADAIDAGIVPLLTRDLVWALPIALAGLAVSLLGIFGGVRNPNVLPTQIGFQLTVLLAAMWLSLFGLYFGMHPAWEWSTWRWVATALSLEFFFY